MDEGKMPDNHLTSAAAFVEGGIQDACDDACSICLEAFCESDPSTVTNCKHEFHLQCVLEWCQRSTKCPMCWQSISLKDPSSQELLDAVEHERSIRMNPPRNTTIFHHPTLGDFELQHLPVNATDADLEDRIIQHLAAAAAMGRARHLGRRDGQRRGSSAQGRSHFLVFSSHPNTPPAAGASPTSLGGDNGIGDSGSLPSIMRAGSSSPLSNGGGDSSPLPAAAPALVDQVSETASGPGGVANQQGSSNSRRSPTLPSPSGQDRAGPSDLQSFSESLKSRFSAMSMRYKESITKSTRGWKERLFSRNSAPRDLGSEARRGGEDIHDAAISSLIEGLENRENSRNEIASVSNSQEDGLLRGQTDQQPSETADSHSLNEANVQAPCAAGSAPN